MRTVIFAGMLAALGASHASAQTAAEQAAELADATAAVEAEADAAAAMEWERDSTSNREPYPVDDYWYPRANPVDYPASAYRDGEEGYISFSLDIDAAGKASNCRVIEGVDSVASSDSAALNAATCAVVMRDPPEFIPAKDEAGKPISGTYSNGLEWQISKPEFTATSIDVVMEIGKDGSVSNCQLLSAQGDLPRGFNKDDPCEDMNRNNAVYRDESGQIVAKRVRLKLAVEVSDVESRATQ